MKTILKMQTSRKDVDQPRALVSVPLYPVVLHLVLTYQWYDETESGRKRTEYRKMTARWKKLIWDRRHKITHVRFARGYTSEMRTYEVDRIDVGKCPIHGWDGMFYRIHFS